MEYYAKVKDALSKSAAKANPIFHTEFWEDILNLVILSCTEYYAKAEDILLWSVARAKPIFPNVIKEERRAIQDLRKDDSFMILTADKGVTPVIMDKDT